MKNLIIALFVTVSCYSQLTVSIPLNTIHFEKSQFFTRNQGGSKGLVLSWTKNHFTAGTGFFENSYGGMSKLLVSGYAFKVKYIDFSLVGGIADNYPKGVKTIKEPYGLYFYKEKEVLYGSRLVPVLMLTTKIKIYKSLGVQINISPAYVNSGIYVNI